MSDHEIESGATTVVLARKSYDHLLRTRDRALREAEWERERTQDHRRWAERSLDEQRRLVDRLNSVCTAAAALGVSIQAINAALAEADAMSTPSGSESSDGV